MDRGEVFEAYRRRQSAELVSPNLFGQELLRLSDVQVTPGRDPYMAAFYEAAYADHQAGGTVAELSSEMLAARPGLHLGEAARLFFNAFQDPLRRRLSNYPLGAESLTDWIDHIHTADHDPVFRTTVRRNLLERHIQTNIPDRYKSVPPILAWLAASGRTNGQMRVMDIGCSLNRGGKMVSLVGKQSAGFSRTEVNADDQTLADRLSDGFNQLQNRPVRGLNWMGIDREDITDPEVREWAKSNLYPREFIDGTARYNDWLDDYQPPEVYFHQRNFLDELQTAYLAADRTADETGEASERAFFNVVTLFTMLSEMSEVDRLILLRIARRYTNPNGLIVIQDFVHVDPDLPTELDFDLRWATSAGHYKTLVLDMAEPYGYQELFAWDSGRPRQVRFNADASLHRTNQEPLRFIDLALAA